MQYLPALIPAILLRRYKRFLADVRLESGEQITVHTPNTGSMLGLADAGRQIWLRDTQNPSRKYRFAWEMSRTAQGALVGVNTHLANRLVQEAITDGVITELQGYASLRTEVAYGEEKSRIDLLLEQPDGRCCYVEIKNVTASLDPGIALFPDAVTQRGTKHLRELLAMVNQGHRAVLFYCVPRNDIQQVQPADQIDPLYGQTLRAALAQGVEAYAYTAEISPQQITLTKSVPVICP